jgi:hypothetical protein
MERRNKLTLIRTVQENFIKTVRPRLCRKDGAWPMLLEIGARLFTLFILLSNPGWFPTV